MKKLHYIMESSLILFLFALTLVFQGCEREPGSIYGMVTLKSTAEPMRATGVELYRNDHLLLKTVTYDDGHYEFTDLTPRNYMLQVDAEGYDLVTYDVVVEAGRQARVDMQLSPVETGMTVITMEAGDVSVINTVLHGKCIYGSSSQPDEYGFYYGTSDIPSRTGTNIKSGNASNNSFSAVVAGPLDPGTYYVQAYAKNSKGTTFGETKSFNVSNNPSVKTLAASNIGTTTATLNGKVLYEGKPKYTEKGFVYSAYFPNPTIDDPSSATTKISVSGNDADFSANIAGLDSNRTYYARAYITNENGKFYGGTISVNHTMINEYVVLNAAKLMVQKHDLGYGDWRTANSMCLNSDLAGYTDWRLPTKDELMVLYNNKKLIGNFTNGEYWSSSLSSTYSDYYYCINFSYGSLKTSDESYNKYVRAVRQIN